MEYVLVDGFKLLKVRCAKDTLEKAKTLGRKAKQVKAPSLKTLEKWSMDGIAKATDGCKVEPDGSCPHGCRSWIVELGVI